MMLKLIGEQQKTSAQLRLENFTMKRMLSAMGPQFRSVMEEDMEANRSSVEDIILTPQTMILKALEREVANMPDDGHSTALANADFHAEVYVKTRHIAAALELKKQTDQKIAMEEEERSKKFVPRPPVSSEALVFTFPGLSPGC